MTLRRAETSPEYFAALRDKAPYPAGAVACAGYYKARWPTKNDSPKPVSIAELQEVDDDDNPIGDAEWVCLVAGRRVSINSAWPHVGRYPITAQQYQEMISGYLSPPAEEKEKPMEPEAPKAKASVLELMQSAELDQIAAALADCQGAIPTIQKGHHAEVKAKDSSKNYEYDYADYADIMDGGVRDALKSAGIAVIHHPAFEGGGNLVIYTRLLHKSGQWLAGKIGFAMNDSRPQQLGAMVTYLKRYSIVALLNIAIADDDDEAAGIAGEGEKVQTVRRDPVQQAAFTWANNLATAIDRMASVEHLDDALSELKTAEKLRRAEAEVPEAHAIVMRAAKRTRDRLGKAQLRLAGA